MDKRQEGVSEKKACTQLVAEWLSTSLDTTTVLGQTELVTAHHNTRYMAKKKAGTGRLFLLCATTTRFDVPCLGGNLCTCFNPESTELPGYTTIPYRRKRAGYLGRPTPVAVTKSNRARTHLCFF